MKTIPPTRIGDDWRATLKGWFASANSTEFLEESDFTFQDFEVINPTIGIGSTGIGPGIAPTLDGLRVNFARYIALGGLVIFKVHMTFALSWGAAGDDSDVAAINFEFTKIPQAIFTPFRPEATSSTFPSGLSTSSNFSEYGVFLVAPARLQIISQASLGPVVLAGPLNRPGVLDNVRYGNYTPDATNRFRIISYNGSLMGNRPAGGAGHKSWITAHSYGFYERSY